MNFATHCIFLACLALSACKAKGLRRECADVTQSVKDCTSNNRCIDGQLCLKQPEISNDTTCGFNKPSKDGECLPNTFVFNGRCVPAAPCNAACTPTRTGPQICNILSSDCESPPDRADASCKQTCPTGTLLVYDNMDASITLGCHTLACVCAPLPDVPLGDFGRFVSMAQSGNHLFASAYDATYGDLLIIKYDAKTLEETALIYADGVPNAGKITGNPTGRRRGRLDKGPNTGTYTAMAVRNERPIVTYFNDDTKSLKIAFVDIDGKTTTGTIHQATQGTHENIGMFSSIVVDLAGVIHVAYFADNITIDAQRVSTPMVARSKIPVPKTPDDWDHLAIEPMPYGAQKIAKPNFTENPPGNGLYTSIAIHNDKVIIAYQDSKHGCVRGATANSNASDFIITTIACGTAQTMLGNHTALRIAPNNDVVIAYGAALSNAVYTYRGEDLTHGTITRIDDGMRTSSDIRVGGPISILFDSFGKTSFIYGDLTNNDVIITMPSKNGMKHHTVLANGAFGSAQSAVITPDDYALVLAHRRSFKQASPVDLLLRSLDLRAF